MSQNRGRGQSRQDAGQNREQTVFARVPAPRSHAAAPALLTGVLRTPASLKTAEYPSPTNGRIRAHTRTRLPRAAQTHRPRQRHRTRFAFFFVFSEFFSGVVNSNSDWVHRGRDAAACGGRDGRCRCAGVSGHVGGRVAGETW